MDKSVLNLVIVVRCLLVYLVYLDLFIEILGVYSVQDLLDNF